MREAIIGVAVAFADEAAAVIVAAAAAAVVTFPVVDTPAAAEEDVMRAADSFNGSSPSPKQPGVMALSLSRTSGEASLPFVFGGSI